MPLSINMSLALRSIKMIDYPQNLRRGFDFNGFVNLLIVHAIDKWDQLLH